MTIQSKIFQYFEQDQELRCSFAVTQNLAPVACDNYQSAKIKDKQINRLLELVLSTPKLEAALQETFKELGADIRDFHDRFIRTDDGWEISLGSGLDFYEKPERFTLANLRQECRKTREFNIIYTKK